MSNGCWDTIVIGRISKYQVFGKNVWNVSDEGGDYSTIRLALPQWVCDFVGNLRLYVGIEIIVDAVYPIW